MHNVVLIMVDEEWATVMKFLGGYLGGFQSIHMILLPYLVLFFLNEFSLITYICAMHNFLLCIAINLFLIYLSQTAEF